MTEKRVEDRYLCADLVRVDWLRGEDEFQTVEAVLEDISPLGGCVQVDHPIPLGATLTITIGESRLTGHVCYCAYRDYGYFVGVRFAGGSGWSCEAVAPRHLVNLQTLLLQSRR
ncbi:MAG TPA: PilZ domain-containing protein [Bryobacteraceae bacterium]|jgi:hypothetical protein|nr:PilZ domain-containing protein [Bryobacteraceae bacterium]